MNTNMFWPLLSIIWICFPVLKPAWRTTLQWIKYSVLDAKNGFLSWSFSSESCPRFHSMTSSWSYSYINQARSIPVYTAVPGECCRNFTLPREGLHPGKDQLALWFLSSFSRLTSNNLCPKSRKWGDAPDWSAVIFVAGWEVHLKERCCGFFVWVFGGFFLWGQKGSLSSLWECLNIRLLIGNIIHNSNYIFPVIFHAPIRSQHNWHHSHWTDTNLHQLRSWILCYFYIHILESGKCQ